MYCIFLNLRRGIESIEENSMLTTFVRVKSKIRILKVYKSTLHSFDCIFLYEHSGYQIIERYSNLDLTYANSIEKMLHIPIMKPNTFNPDLMISSV